ncbi:Uncharacterised protein [uncultured archaeon]|nr:Uncharacterised protein [uncultured archaeon]
MIPLIMLIASLAAAGSEANKENANAISQSSGKGTGGIDLSGMKAEPEKTDNDNPSVETQKKPEIKQNDSSPVTETKEIEKNKDVDIKTNNNTDSIINKIGKIQTYNT